MMRVSFPDRRKKELNQQRRGEDRTGGDRCGPPDLSRVRDVMTFTVNDPVLGEDIAAMVVRTESRVTEQSCGHTF